MINDRRYVLVDTEKKLIIDKIQELPEYWKNISGLPGLSDEELEDLSWAGHFNLGWININSAKIDEYELTLESLNMNKTQIRQLVSDGIKEQKFNGIVFKNIRVRCDDELRYDLWIKKMQAKENLDQTFNCKISDQYYTFTSNQIIELCNKVEEHFQKCSDKEMNLFNKIDSCKKISNLLKIKL